MTLLNIKRLTKTATLPTQAHEGDAAFDIYSDQRTIIKAGERKAIKTGIATSFPTGHVLLIKDRSGLAAKHGLTTLAGVIDSGYRGEILVVMLNTSEEDYRINKKDRIAQALILPLPEVTIKEVEELEHSERGEKGIGSSGK